MNKEHIILWIMLILVILIIPSCTNSNSKNPDYVPSSKEIPNMDGEINIISSEKNIKRITTDQLYAKGKTVKLEDMIDEKIHKALVMGALGQVEEIEEDGYFEAISNSIAYIYGDGKEQIENVKGVIINPPANSITDSYYDIAHFLEEENVLCFLLDGFGYHQYKYAIETGYIPFLEKQPEAAKALSVYRPVTNAGLAAIITGKLPIENGVYSRKQRELQVDSIFKKAKDLDKKSIYIEGNIGILNTEIDPVLNIDKDGDGFTDDEVFESAFNAINKDYNLVFVHFHGIDDAGHTHGDLSSETMEVIAKIDRYLEEIVSNWDGKVIITADHGMHSTEGGGDHGQFRYEDMIVPYIIIGRGNPLE